MDPTRHVEMFDPSEHGENNITIVGAGAIGSGLVEGLVRIGFKHLEIYDNDILEEVNRSNQLYAHDQVNMPKVDAAVLKAQAIEPKIDIVGKAEKFDGQNLTSEIVMSAVDNMATRKAIYEAVKDNPFVQYFVDGRMGGYEFHVYAINLRDEEQKAFYEKTLFNDDQAVQERCTFKSIIYNVFGVSSIMINELTKMLKGEKHSRGVIFDYHTNAMLTM